jgi:hypothetical protein
MRSSSPLSCSLIVVLMSGCVIRGDARGLAYGIDGALALTGAVLVADASQTKCSGWDVFCDAGKAAQSSMGAVMLVGGLAGLLLTVMVNAGGAPDAEADRAYIPLDLDLHVNVDVDVDVTVDGDIDVNVDVDVNVPDTRSPRPGPPPSSPTRVPVKPECRPYFDAIHAAATEDDKRAAVAATPDRCFGL